ncbi:MAG: pilus assembly protein, partial [Armatimonadetes bacterium]|nr:pilus assembly protein [Armatimonadota bacterium]
MPILPPCARSGGEGRERGHAVVELAVTLPLLLLLAGGIVDGGWLWHQVQSVTHAAAAGARRGALVATGAGECSGAPSPAVRAAVERAVRDASPSLDPRRMAVSVEYAEPGCVGRLRTLRVSVTYRLQALTPYLGRLVSETQHRGAAVLAVEMVAPEWARSGPPAWWGAGAPGWWGQSPPAWWGAGAPGWW